MKDAQFICPHCGEELKSRWIPVSERLPEDGTNVLFTDNSGGTYLGHHVSSAPQWEDHYSYWHSDWYQNVTHWMPLPEPPAED